MPKKSEKPISGAMVAASLGGLAVETLERADEYGRLHDYDGAVRDRITTALRLLRGHSLTPDQAGRAVADSVADVIHDEAVRHALAAASGALDRLYAARSAALAAPLVGEG